MSDKEIRCLAAGEILAYLDAEVAEPRKAEIDRHLDECRLCAEAVEGVGGLEWREGFLRSTDSLLARVRTRTAQAASAAGARRSASRFRPRPQYLTLAATLLLGVGGAVLFTRPDPGEDLFRRQFEPYPSLRPVVRGSATETTSNALRLYEARDYRRALAAFEESLAREPNDPTALLYAGLSRLSLGEAQEAIPDLEKVLQLGKDELKVPAEWYLALAHLREAGHRGGHDFAEARSRLRRIAEGGGFYRDKARALLSELDRLEAGN
jgi:tetratricopeptide (TPR) repeat protein